MSSGLTNFGRLMDLNLLLWCFRRGKKNEIFLARVIMNGNVVSTKNWLNTEDVGSGKHQDTVCCQYFYMYSNNLCVNFLYYNDMVLRISLLPKNDDILNLYSSDCHVNKVFRILNQFCTFVASEYDYRSLKFYADFLFVLLFLIKNEWTVIRRCIGILYKGSFSTIR